MMSDIRQSGGRQAGRSVEIVGPKDLVPRAGTSMTEQPFAPSAFNLASTMKERLGLVGRVMIGFEERKVAREELKQVLKNELRAQTELMLHRARIDLDFYKKTDQAAHAVRVRKVEEFLFNEESKMQHTLNEMIDRFEDAFTEQFVANKNKLQNDLESGKIDKGIHDMRLDRAYARYEAAMDKTLNDMNMIIDNHKVNLANTLKSFV